MRSVGKRLADEGGAVGGRHFPPAAADPIFPGLEADGGPQGFGCRVAHRITRRRGDRASRFLQCLKQRVVIGFAGELGLAAEIVQRGFGDLVVVAVDADDLVAVVGEQALQAGDAGLVERYERWFLGQGFGEIGFAFGGEFGERNGEGVILACSGRVRAW